MKLTREQLNTYGEMQAADDAWQVALEQRYGRNAGDARYDSRGCATPELMALKTAFRRANDAWRNSFQKETA